MKKRTLLISALSVFLLGLSSCDLGVIPTSSALYPDNSNEPATDTSAGEGDNTSAAPDTTSGGAQTSSNEGTNSSASGNTSSPDTTSSASPDTSSGTSQDTPVTQYTITFAPGTGGSGTMNPVQAPAGAYTLPTCTFTAPSGKEFKAWSIESVEYNAGASYTVAGNVTATAIWLEVMYDVTFDANGGTGEMAPVNVHTGDTYPLPTCTFVAPSGKQFKAWLVGSEEKSVGEEITITANTSVKAVWENIPTTTYTVTYTANGGTGSDHVVNDKAGTYVLEENTFFEAPAHKEFKCWSVNDVEHNASTSITVSANTTVKAIWQDIQYTITFDANGGSGTMDPDHAAAGSYTLPTCTFTAPTGKQFKKWLINTTEYAAGASYTVEGNVTVTAIWEDAKYMVSFNANGGTGEMDSVEKVHGSTYELPANGFTRDGYHFIGWLVGTDDTNRAPGYEITVTSAVTIKANWEADGYYLAGTFNSWNPTNAYSLEEVTTGHFSNMVTLHQGDEFQVVRIEGNTTYYYQNIVENDGTDIATTYKNDEGSAYGAGYLVALGNHNFQVVVPGQYFIEYTSEGIWTELWYTDSEHKADTLILDRLQVAAGAGEYTDIATFRKDNESGNLQYEYQANIVQNTEYHLRWHSQEAVEVALGNTALPYFTIGEGEHPNSVVARGSFSNVTFYLVLSGNVVTLYATGPATYAIVGSMNGWHEGDTSHALTPTLVENQVARSGISFVADEEFKVVINGSWTGALDYSNLDAAAKALEYSAGHKLFEDSGNPDHNIVVKAPKYFTLTINTLTGDISVTIDQVTISKKPSADGAVTTETIDRGSNYTLPANPYEVPANKVFAGWMVNEVLKQQGDVLPEVLADTTIVASWADLYTITFAAGEGGSGSKDPVVMRAGSYTLPAVTGFTHATKIFESWQINTSYYQPGDVVSINSNTTVTAIWTNPPVTTYTVTYVHGNGGTGADYLDTDKAGSYTLLSNTITGFVADANKQFKCWFVNDAEHNVGTNIVVNSATTVTAVWEDVYTISFAKNGGSNAMADVHMVAGDYELPACTFTAPAGKQFKCWSVNDVEKAVGDTIAVAANVTVTAVWKYSFECYVNGTPVGLALNNDGKPDGCVAQYSGQITPSAGNTLVFKYNGETLANVTADDDCNLYTENSSIKVSWSSQGNIFLKDMGSSTYKVYYGLPEFDLKVGGSTHAFTPQTPEGTDKGQFTITLAKNDVLTVYYGNDLLNLGETGTDTAYTSLRPGSYTVYVNENYRVFITAPAKSGDDSNITATKNGSNIALTNIKVGGTDIAQYSIALAKGDVVVFNDGYDVLSFPNCNPTTSYVAPENGTYTFYVNSEYNVYVSSLASSVTAEPVTIYLTNNLGWSNLKAHHWKEGVSGTTWPGDEMTYVYTNDKGEDVYKVTVDLSQHDQIIFNGSGGQTVDISLSGITQNAYWLSSTKQDGKYTVGGQWTCIHE